VGDERVTQRSFLDFIMFYLFRMSTTSVYLQMTVRCVLKMMVIAGETHVKVPNERRGIQFNTFVQLTTFKHMYG